MRYIYLTALLICSLSANCQNIIDWDDSYELELSDFQSPRTRIGSGDLYSLSVPAHINFSFHMSSYEFMFTKNFNFFQPIYDNLEKEYIERSTATQQETDLGRDQIKLDSLHKQVKREIGELSDFCKNCKPPKRKKQKSGDS